MPLSTANISAPASNTAAVVTLAAKTVGRDYSGIFWSYSAAPTNGQLTVENGGDTVIKLYITASGPGFLPFNGTIEGDDNEAVTVTLSAGGSGVSGSVMVIP